MEPQTPRGRRADATTRPEKPSQGKGHAWWVGSETGAGGAVELGDPGPGCPAKELVWA